MSFHCPNCQTLVDDSHTTPFDDVFLCDACDKWVNSHNVIPDTYMQIKFTRMRLEKLEKESYENWLKEASKSDEQRNAESMWWTMVIVLGGTYTLYFLGCI